MVNGLMPFPSRSSLSLLPLSAGFLLLAVVVGSGLWLSVRQERAASWVRHSLEVENDLNLIQLLVADAETGQRGFLMTGSAEYLAPYRSAVSRLPGEIAALASETSDNPRQRVPVADLRSAVWAKLGELASTIELVRLRRGGEAMAVMRGGAGQRHMAAITEAIDRMRVEERRLLAERTRAADRITRITRIVLGASALLVVVLAILAIREARHRVARLRSANDRLVLESTARDEAESQLRQVQKMETLGHLTGGIAHDFNNMLAIVLGSLELLRRRLGEGDEAKVLRYLDTATEGAQRAATLTTRLLAFARRQPLEPTVVDPNRLVGTVSELIHRTVSESIDIETVPAAGIWRIFVDASQLEHAILNLAINARDAMASGGKLTIETSNADLDERYARQHEEVAAGQYVMISITDTGTGMSPEVASKAIEPFFTTKDVGKGTGLGLSQVYGFVKQSGGHFKIYSEPGAGTTIKLYLPRYVGDEGASAGTVQAGEAHSGPLGSVVLVVEDEEQVRRTSIEALSELGYSVLEAANGAQALELLRSETRIDLLFTDVVMPGMSGRELADEALRLRPGLKVLYTTGYTRNAIIHNGVVDAGVAFLPKPFTLDALARKVRAVLDGA